MKIGIVTEYYYPLLGGISENVHNTRTRLEKLGHEVAIVTSSHRSTRRAAGAGGSTVERGVIRIGRSVPVYSNGSFAHMTVGLGLEKRLRNVLDRERFDILHLHSPMVPTLPLLALLGPGSPRVGTFHTYFEGNLVYSALNGNLQRTVDRLDGQIAVSGTCIEALGRYFRLNARVIPNGVDTDEFNPEVPPLEQYADCARNLLFLSRFDPRNGLRLMLRAFGIVKAEVPDARLIVVGDGPLRRYYSRFVPSAHERDVHFVGRVKAQRARYYASCDVFCSPVMKASFGVTLLEAMASGKPIVATENRGYRELLGPDEGILTPAADPKAFARAIIELLKDDAMRRRMGASGRTKAMRYSWDAVVEEIAAYYREILSRR
jgi:phosphatidyl-myo-inositol alpha-mannosyltransferase